MSVACRKCEGNIGETVDQEEKLCNEVKTAKEIVFFLVTK